MSRYAEAVTRRCSVREVFLNIHRKTPLPESLFYKASGLQLYKKETLAQALSCEFCETFKNTFFIEYLRWLFLSMDSSNTM